jgi:hypothetical protein
MEYDFTKPPDATSVYTWRKNKKAHLYFHQEARAYAAFMFQSKEMEDYFIKQFSLTYHPKGRP